MRPGRPALFILCKRLLFVGGMFMRKRPLRLLSFYLIAALCLITGYYIWERIPNSHVSGISDAISGTRLIIGGLLISGENPPIVRDGQILLSFDTIKAHIDPYIWWDKNLRKITITTKDHVIRMKTGSLDALVNDEPMELKFSAVDEDGLIYLPVDLLKDFYGIDLNYIESNDVVVIDFKNSIYRIGSPLNADVAIRKGMSIKEPILKQFSDADLNSDASGLIIFEEYQDWYKVRTDDGILGFIRKADMAVSDITLVRREPEEVLESPPLPGGKINLVWEMTSGSKHIEYGKSNTPGIDIMAPTWFEITDPQGNIKNQASEDYVEWAHANGWQVWALFSNDFDDLDGTSGILNNSDIRQEIIRQIVAYAALYHLDGINVDFENMYMKDKDAYTEFIRELYPILKEQGLTVSADISIPGGSETWSQCFDRKALSESVDYLCLMTYDQYWASSPVAGSAAELDWVEKGLKATLKEVSPEKLLLGIPLYTRLWTEEEIDGEIKVSSIALTIADARQTVEDNNAQIVWDPTDGQYATSFEKDGKTQKMWLEDADSVNTKSSLVHKYNIAGACIWAANFADESVWPVLERNLKQVANYDEWKDLYSSPAR